MLDGLFQEVKRKTTRTAIIFFIISAISFALLLLLIFSDLDNGDGVGYFVFVVAFLICGVLGVFYKFAFPNRAKKQIESYCAKTPNPDATRQLLAQTWNYGADFKIGRVDKNYIIALINGNVKILTLQDAINVSRTRVMIIIIPFSALFHVRNRGGEMQSLSVSLFHYDYLDLIQGYVFENCPHIYIGFDIDIAKLINDKNWPALQELAYTQRWEAGMRF